MFCLSLFLCISMCGSYVTYQVPYTGGRVRRVTLCTPELENLPCGRPHPEAAA